MEYTREKQKRFLDLELQAIAEEYIKKLNKEALVLLAEQEIYVTQFTKIDIQEQKDENDNVLFTGSGEMILKFRSDKGIPRKNDYFTAIVLDKNVDLPPKWKGLSWGDLRKNQLEFSEIHCVWHGKTDEKGYLLCGFQGVSLEMAKYLADKVGCVIILGPKEPPMDYYQHLIGSVAKEGVSPSFDKMLDFDVVSSTLWNPIVLKSDEDRIDRINKEFETSDELIIQGPPGTGKTYLMAQFIQELLNSNKSVLVTALTNRALIELAEKEFLSSALENGKIWKTSVSTDEASKLPKLIPIESKKISCSKGVLTLATFYNASGWAESVFDDNAPFDYVIMDEASQALYAMIASCKKLGNKIIWIGDQKQLPPIVCMKDEIVVRNNFGRLANGFETLCENFKYPAYILTDTYRLTKRSADFTSVFYPTSLSSVSQIDFQQYDIPYLHKEGGPSILYVDMPRGTKTDMTSANYAINIAGELLSKDPKSEIAILAKFKDSVKTLQNCFIAKYGNKNNVLIDTVERIQGMTRDFVIYYIPNTMMTMSLDTALFNVATSRAKRSTIIIADKSILNENMSDEVRRYLLKIEENKVATFNEGVDSIPKVTTTGNDRVTVLGKINLPEKHFKEIVEDKENIFVIDTNVFVKCPSIISRIGKYKVIIPTTVLEELDHLKMKPDIDKKALSDAAKNINLAFQKQYSHMEAGDSSLLPEGFDSKKADCLILSVALKYKNEGKNAILLTSDQLLQSKAWGLGVTTISLSEFLKERKH